jgi:type IV pilus assembly protein PilC
MNQSLGAFNLVLLAAPGVALWIAVRILYGRRSFVASDPLKVVLTVSSTLLMVLAALGLVLGLAGPTSSPIGFLIVWVPVLIGIVIVLLMSLDRFRQGEHRSLVWTLAAAAQRGIPLPEAARAYADEAQNDTGARALVLADHLEQGLPLSRAARAARLRLATPMRVAVGIGEELGMLGPAMKQQLDDSVESESILRAVLSRVYYLWVVILIAGGVLTFVMLRIVPVFQKMFQEFDLELPSMTRRLIGFCNWFVSSGWILTAPLMFVFLVAGLISLFGGSLYFLGWTPRDLPGVWHVFKRYDGALVMRALALVVRRGVSLAQGLELLAARYPIQQVAMRLRVVAAEVSQGARWQESLERSGLISAADAGVLSAAERADNLPWALEEMADSALRRQTYRLQLILHLLYPLVVLLLGGWVAFFVIGLFLPLLSLIQGLS